LCSRLAHNAQSALLFHPRRTAVRTNSRSLYHSALPAPASAEKEDNANVDPNCKRQRESTGILSWLSAGRTYCGRAGHHPATAKADYSRSGLRCWAWPVILRRPDRWHNNWTLRNLRKLRMSQQEKESRNHSSYYEPQEAPYQTRPLRTNVISNANLVVCGYVNQDSYQDNNNPQHEENAAEHRENNAESNPSRSSNETQYDCNKTICSSRTRGLRIGHSRLPR